MSRKKSGHDDLDQQLSSIDKLIADHMKLGKQLHRLKREATTEQRIAMLEKQVHDLQLVILHMSRSNTIQAHLAHQRMEKERLEAENKTMEEVLKVIARAKSIGSA